MRRIRYPAYGILIILLFCAAFSSAGADSARRLRPCYRIPRVAGNAAGTGGAALSGPATAETCGEYTWTVSNPEEGCGYELVMSIQDGSYAEEDICDTLYIKPRSTGQAGQSLSYVFYEPGQYVLFAQVFEIDGENRWRPRLDEAGREVYLFRSVTVTEGSGENRLMDAVRTAADACRKENEYDTALAIHDYLCGAADYDYDYEYYSPEGLLLEGRAVCNGYSRAYQLIAREAGLECRRVTGSGGDDRHAWNVVKINGKWYQVDVTWDDTDSVHGARHRYFGLTDELIFLDHSAEKTVGGNVTCGSLTDNYHIRSGSWKKLASEIIPATQEQVNGRRHSISVPLNGQAYDEYGARAYDDNQNYITARIVEYAYNNGMISWKCEGTGEVFLLSGAECLFDEFDRPSELTGQMTLKNAKGTLVLPAGLKRIETEAFAGEAANFAVIPEGCTTIRARAFAGGRLWEITIPASVTTIDPGAFEGTSGVLIRTPAGSNAAVFAREHNMELAVTDQRQGQ